MAANKNIQNHFLTVHHIVEQLGKGQEYKVESQDPWVDYSKDFLLPSFLQFSPLPHPQSFIESYEIIQSRFLGDLGKLQWKGRNHQNMGPFLLIIQSSQGIPSIDIRDNWQFNELFKNLYTTFHSPNGVQWSGEHNTKDQ